MESNQSIYNNSWLSKLASTKRPLGSWVDGVMDNLEGSGRIYLDIIKRGFDSFPASNDKKKELKNSLENYKYDAHLGGVNEIAWYEFMKLQGWSVEVVEKKRKEEGRRPDFRVNSPADFFCEVTTSNVSQEEKKRLLEFEKYYTEKELTKKTEEHIEKEWKRHGVPIDSQQDKQRIDRILQKIIEKFEQIEYGANQNKPTILVAFDYTELSGYSTEFYIALANYLLSYPIGFIKLPSELSAIIYIERRFEKQQIRFSKKKSAVYHNPCARYKLPKIVFTMMRQYELVMSEVKPSQCLTSDNDWIVVMS